MRKSLASTIVSASSWLSVACVVAATMALTSLAKASTVIYEGVGTDPNSSAATSFDGAPGLSTGPFTGPYTQFGSNLTFSSTGGAMILNPATSGSNGAEPFGDTSQYLSVLGGGSATVTVNKGTVNTVSFLWGSVDLYNTITFYNGSTVIGTFTGADITPKIPDGCQTSPDCTGYVTFFDPTQLITSFVLSSSENSFETDDFLATQVGTPPVPEVSTWVMMILGFFSVGLVSYRRRGVSFRMV
jgi:hypothetical protein